MYIEIRLKYQKIILLSNSRAFSLSTPMENSAFLSALELFHCLPPLFHCVPLSKTVRLHGKKLQNATKDNSHALKLASSYFKISH